MKKISILLIIIFAGVLTSCDSPENQKKSAIAHELKVFNQAYEYGDIGTAIYAVHSMIIRDTAQTHLYDTLALLYYNSQNFNQAIKSANYSMKRKGESAKMLLVVANSLKFSNRNAEALPYFFKLAEATKNPTYVYEVAVLSFYNNDINKATEAANQLLNTPGAEKYYVNINFNNNQVQSVPIRAALLNLLGFIAQKNGDMALAKERYQAALDYFPDFILAKNNLGLVSKSK